VGSTAPVKNWDSHTRKRGVFRGRVPNDEGTRKNHCRSGKTYPSKASRQARQYSEKGGGVLAGMKPQKTYFLVSKKPHTEGN